MLSHCHIQRFGHGGVRIESVNNEPLDIDVMRAHAPTIFADHAHESRSEKFVHIPTDQMLRALMKEGFQPMALRVGGSKDIGKRDFTKHMIRLRRVGEDPKVGGLFPEVVLKNGHDGTSQYRLMVGLFRMICMNGLIVPENLFGDVTVPHKGDAISKVIEGSYSVISHADEVLGKADEMRAVQLQPDEARAFALAAAQLRFDEVPQAILDNPVNTILRARRSQDRQPDLWTTFNRAQENLSKGGIGFFAEREREDGSSQIVHRSTRPVQSVDGDIKLNRALWTLADEMQKLKGGA